MPRKKIKTRRKKIDKFKDSDADGLADILEKKLGTDPNKADSDNDGVGDFEEVSIYGTDPLDPDTDKDGMKDGEEIKRGRNPAGPGLLKDLFIPHKGNNYEPRALHPYRLLFYALSSIMFKAILIGAVIILPIEAWLTPDILIEQSKKVIGLTNIIRKNLKLPELSESQLLNRAAEEKANDMLLKQYFSHSGPDNRSLADWLKRIKYNFSVAGENLAIGFNGPEEVVNGWSRSPTHYQNMTDPDFKEIGVGMASGPYENVDTTLVAQYFASPLKPVNPPNQQNVLNGIFPELINEEKIPAIPPSLTKALGEKTAVNSEETAVIIKTAGPQIDHEKSKLYIDEPIGQSAKIVRAEIYLSSETAKARVMFNNYILYLAPEDQKSGKWAGQTIIFKEDQEQIFKPAILPVIIAEGSDGNITIEDLKWESLKPLNASLLKQYYFIKQHQSPYLKPLFGLTAGFYKIILLMAIICLGLNVFIQVKKQKPRIIFSTLGLIGLLVFLIVI